MSTNKWLEEEIEKLVMLIGKHELTSKQMGDILGRSSSAVRNKAFDMGLEIYTKRVRVNAENKTVKVQTEDELRRALSVMKSSSDWKIIKVRKKTKKTKGKKNKKFDTVLIVADHHIPYHNNVVIKAHLKLMDDIDFDKFIILGDFMDMGPISHWNRSKSYTVEGMRLRRDYIEGNALLDEYDKRLPKHCIKEYYFGNHECWIYDLYELQPALAPSKDGEIPGYGFPTQELKLEERGYIIHEEPNYIGKLGRLSITHGVYTGSNHTKAHIDQFKTNVLYGHLHTRRTRLENSPAKEISLEGDAIGCNCNMNPSYMKNKPHMWSHGFAIVYVYPDKQFQVDNIRVVKNKFIYNGKEYDGSK